MKSSLFSRFDPEGEANKDLKRHLRFFLGLDDGQRDACVAALPKLALASTKQTSRAALEEVEAACKASGFIVSSVMNLLNFFLDKMIDKHTREDSEGHWCEDLVEMGWLTDAEARTLERRLAQVRSDVLPRVQDELLRREYAVGVFPSLSSFGVTVELRAVQRDKFYSGQSVAEYEPNIQDVVPVASVHIGVDRGPIEHFFFQLDTDDIQMLIDDLEAAKKDMNALKDAVTFTRRESGA